MEFAADPRGRGIALRLFLAFCAVVCLAWGPQAEARRAALIIGNGGYVNATTLTNPVNDARLVAGAAQKAGFDVTLVTDVTRDGFDKALRDFRQQADGADVAMVYFAGHGIESGGKNWLLPVDVQLAESRDLRFEAIELDGLLETLAGAQLRIVILDACRNNPFGNAWRGASRSVNKGLAETEVEGALVIYAAAGGQVATDGTGGNSPFARSLATRLPEPGLSIHRLGSALLDDVAAATGGQQRPWTNMSIPSREFYLVDPIQAAPVAAPQPVMAAAPTNNAAADALMWQGADQANTVQGYQAYVGLFPGGIFANTARDRIAKLTAAAAAPAPQVAVATRTVAPVEAPAPQPIAQPVIAPPPAAAIAAPAVQPALAQPMSATPPPFEPTSNLLAVRPYEPPAGTAPPPSTPGFITVIVPPGGPALPGLPAAPRFSDAGYPTCREDYQSVADPIGKVDAINRCMSALDGFFESTMNGYSKAMILHQDEISRIYSDQVGGKGAYSPEEQDAFYRAMMKEHADSNPGGPNFAEYAVTRARYDQDRTYLKDRYCWASGTCGGYPVPAGIAPVGK